ncbi:SigE family RNA polymerase sigma factor [Catellatospora coxensis]|nr:SigE family RNA polymerase sigma factor [Catellatospora coxensis]
MAEEGFREFVQLRYGELLRTAFLLTGSTHAAEDLVQSALLKAYRRWETVDEPMAYLRRALVNQRTSVWRRIGSRELLTGVLPERGRADGSAAQAERDELLAALATLPVRMRAVLVLRYWEDMSEADTALVAPEAGGIWRVEVETDQGGFGFHSDADLGGADAMIALESWWLNWPSTTPGATPDTGPTSTRILVLAPRQAVAVRLLDAGDRAVATVVLVDGVGVFPYDGKAEWRLQAVDATGAVVATGKAPFRSFDSALEKESISWY